MADAAPELLLSTDTAPGICPSRGGAQGGFARVPVTGTAGTGMSPCQPKRRGAVTAFPLNPRTSLGFRV